MIEPLSGASAPEPGRIGGKGCGLVRLLRADFRVPQLWCLPADREFDPERLAAALADLVAAHPDTVFAVRSSATAEDWPGASFAGVYASVLGVRGADALNRAVRVCRDSLQSPAARAYREARGISHDVRMAVLIQRMLEPDVAGVLLGANPQRPFAHEIVIDAAYGMGEGVVSGRADPDHLVLDRETGEIRRQRIGAKRVALRPRAGTRPGEEPVPEEARARLCLDAAQRRALFELSRRIARSLGPRMDVEWAFAAGQLHLLQARPMTGLPPEEPEEVWSRRFGDEYISDYTTPSGFTFLVRWIREFTFTDNARLLGRRDLLAMEPLRRHHGYVYLSGRYACALVRGVPRGSRQAALRDWFSPLWSRRVAREPFSPWLLLKGILLPLRDPNGSMSRNLAALDDHAERVMRELRPRLSEDTASLSDEELTARLEEVDEIGCDHFRVIRWGMGQYAPALHAGLRDRLERWLGDTTGETYQQLVSGLPETRTSRINRDLWHLGELARGDPPLAAGLRAGRGGSALRAATPRAAFWPAFDRFVALHGHRSTTRDPSQPRWSETPELILALVCAQLGGASSPPDPAQLEAGSRARRREALEGVEGALGRGPRAFVRRRLLRWICEKVVVFTAYRENQRYTLDAIVAQLRFLLLEHGRRLARSGVLDDAWQVFLLEAGELRELFASRRGGENLRARLAERRAHYEKWRQRLPATFLFDEIETEGEVVEGDPVGRDAGLADGLGASRGVVRGRVRVLGQAMGLARIEPGEILVAPNIDPGWTTVFPLLGGLVCETGGLLSHGALLAREYGIPAVMGVRAATTRFETGMWLVLDGARGTVEIVD